MILLKKCVLFSFWEIVIEVKSVSEKDILLQTLLNCRINRMHCILHISFRFSSLKLKTIEIILPI